MPPKRKPGTSTRRMSVDGDFRPPTSNPPSPQVDKRRPKRSATTLNKISPAKPSSRLQPSQPLHMTTRRAASKAATNSNASSLGSAGSRRSSLNDATQLAGGMDIDADRPTKKARLSDRSSTTTDSKSLVRRAQSRSPEMVTTSNQDHNIPDIIVPLDVPLIEEPDHATLLEGGPVVNGRQDDGESDVQRMLSPLPKRRGRGRPKAKRGFSPAGSLAESFAPGTPFNGDSLDIGTDRDVPKAAKKLPGRRRAPNADPLMEACLRRQLQLRVGHRAVSKALKPILLELAHRTSVQLAKQDDAEVAEVECLMKAELQRKLDARMRIIDNEMRIKSQYLSDRLKCDEEELAIRYRDRLLAVQEDYEVRLEHRILQLGRQYEHERDDDATDDENGDTIHPLHGRPSKGNPTGTLDARYDSRSRFFMETKRLEQSCAWRTKIGTEQTEIYSHQSSDSFDDDSPVDQVITDELPESFGSFNHSRREEAIVALNIHTLMNASTEVERQAFESDQKLQNISLVSNADASGLQALATAIDMEHDLASTLGVPIHVLHFQPQLHPSTSTISQSNAAQDEKALASQMRTDEAIHDPLKLDAVDQVHTIPHKSLQENSEKPSTPEKVTPRSSRRRAASQVSHTDTTHQDVATPSPFGTNHHETQSRTRSKSIIMSSPGGNAQHDFTNASKDSEDVTTEHNGDRMLDCPSPRARHTDTNADIVHHDPIRAHGLTSPVKTLSSVGASDPPQQDRKVQNGFWPTTGNAHDVVPNALLGGAQSRHHSDVGPAVSSITAAKDGQAAAEAVYGGPDIGHGAVLPRHQLAPPLPVQPHGVFFGPPPPPQYGQQRAQHPWYRQ